MRSTLCAVAAVLAMGVFALPAAAAPLDGLASVSIEGQSNPDCTLVPDRDLCVVSYDTRGTPEPGDDEAGVADSIDEARVNVLPMAPSAGFGVDVGNLTIHHPFDQDLNATWQAANASLPPSLKQFATLESRPANDPSRAWGVFLVLHPPVPIPLLNGGSTTYLSPISVCWDLGYCGPVTVSRDWVRSDDGEVTVLPEHAALGDDSDKETVNLLLAASDCTVVSHPFQNPTVCAAQSSLQPSLAEAAAIEASATPNVVMHFRVVRGDLDLGRGSAPEGPDAALHPAVEMPGGAAAPSDAHASGLDGAAPPGADPWHFPREDAVAPEPDDAATPRLLDTISTVATAPGHLPLFAASVAAMMLLGALLYHRITRERALNQVTRRRVFDHITAQPGTRVGTIARSLGVDYKTVGSHVRVLERLQLVSAVGEYQRRYYPAGRIPTDPAAELLLNPSARAVYALVVAERSADLPTIRAKLGLASSTVSLAASRLARTGLVVRRRDVTSRRVVLEAARELHGSPGRAPS